MGRPDDVVKDDEDDDEGVCLLILKNLLTSPVSSAMKHMNASLTARSRGQSNAFDTFDQGRGAGAGKDDGTTDETDEETDDGMAKGLMTAAGAAGADRVNDEKGLLTGKGLVKGLNEDEDDDDNEDDCATLAGMDGSSKGFFDTTTDVDEEGPDANPLFDDPVRSNVDDDDDVDEDGGAAPDGVEPVRNPRGRVLSP